MKPAKFHAKLVAERPSREARAYEEFFSGRAQRLKIVSAQPGRGVIGSDAVVTAFLMAV
jgi:hypothetical protein